MGMTNEEAIEWIEALVETMLHETTVGPFPDPEYRDEVYKALDMAVETMRKYQKIEDIYYHQTGRALEDSLREVVENGAINSSNND